MRTANATTSEKGNRTYFGLDISNLRPFETGDTKKVFESERPRMELYKIGDLVSDDDWSLIVCHAMHQNPGIRLTDKVLIGRTWRSPIKFFEVIGGKKYRQNGANIYEVK